MTDIRDTSDLRGAVFAVGPVMVTAGILVQSVKR